MNSTQFSIWLIAGDNIHPIEVVCDEVEPSSTKGGYYDFYNDTQGERVTVAMYPIERTAIVGIVDLKEKPFNPLTAGKTAFA